MPVSPEMQSAWTAQWKTGQFDSLPNDRAAGRLVALDSAWADFFTGLPDDARLLDLATGGGEVIRSAIASGRNFRLAGVDIADLSVVSDSLRGVELKGNTDLSRLPFPDAVFDGVTSQFGVEYADIPTAMQEAVRVMTSGARGQFVLHHAGGAITQGVVNSIAADDLLLADGGALQLGKRVFELHRRSAPPAVLAAAETEFRRAVGDLQSRLRSDPTLDALRNVVAFLASLAAASGISAGDAIHKLDNVEQQLRARHLRKLAQRDAALDERGMENLVASLVRAGATVNPPGELKYPTGKILAWCVTFSK